MVVSGWTGYVSRAHAACLATDDPAQVGGRWVPVESTLVLADVSGFTALSERLARRGSAGAEELTDIVNIVVNRLLAAVLPFDADLLKYGGDALLLLFSGQGHEERAAAATEAMRSTLDVLRRFRSESGRVDLRMSIGVESGVVDLFLVGTEHRELVVAGDVASAVVRTQQAAPAGGILLGASSAGSSARRAELSVTKPSVTKPWTTEPRLLSEDVPVDPDLVRSGIPVALRSRIGRGRGGSEHGEHRQAAVAFLRIGGLDTLRQADGPDAVTRALHALVTVVQRACSVHGITFLGSDVDESAVKLILVAGAPSSFGDDEDRLVAAVREALDRALDEVCRTPAGPTVRAGLHRGRVFAVDVGDERRRVYTVLGDSVNLAARMMAAAPDGGLLATAELARRLRQPYERTVVPSLAVKGKSDPVPAVLIGRAGGSMSDQPDTTVATARGLAPLDGPFVGRREELAEIVAVMRRAATDGPQLVEVTGEAGIGKSRLLAEACSDPMVPDVVVVQGRQYAALEAYRALREPLRRLLGVPRGADDRTVGDALRAAVHRHVPELESMLPLLGVPFGLALPDTTQTADLAPDYRQEQIHMVASRLLAALLPPGGVLVIEDVNWLDDGSQGLLTRLVRVLSGRPWTVLIARRPKSTSLDLQGLQVTRLELTALRRSAARELAERLGARSDVSALVERSGGNPLYLKEIAAATVEGVPTSELPDTLESAIAAHLDSLTPQLREIVRVASVLGSDFGVRQLADMLEAGTAGTAGPAGTPDMVDTVERGLPELAGVLVPDDSGQVRFAHGLIREGAYAGLSFRRRRRLHVRAAQLIEATAVEPERHAAVLSLHYDAARRPVETWRWSLLAADQATRNAAPVEAVTLFARALEAARPAGVQAREIAEACIRMGDVAELGGLYDQALAAYRRARRLLASEPVEVADLFRKQGHVVEHSGRYSVALRYFSRGFRALEDCPVDPRTRRVKVDLTLATAAVRLRQGQYGKAIPLLRPAVSEAEQIGHRSAVARAYYLLDWAYTDLGEPHPEYRELALPIYEELGDLEGQANVLNNLGVDAYYEGEWGAALDYYRRSREAVERIGHADLAAIATNNIGEILCDQGHFAAARAEFEAALDVWRLSGYAIGIGLATANLGRVAARSGDFEAGGTLLAEAIALLRGIGAESVVIDAQCREIERLVLANAPRAAIALAEEIMSGADQPVQRAYLDRMIGLAYVQLGNLEAATIHLEASLETARAAGAAYEEARCLAGLMRISGRLTGRLTGTVDAERYTRATDILDRLGVIWSPSPPLAVTPSPPSCGYAP